MANCKPQYLEVELTDEEKQVILKTLKTTNEAEVNEALRIARGAKLGEQRMQEYFKRVKEYKKFTITDPHELISFIQARTPYTIDVYNKEVIKKLAAYFTNHASFEQMGEGFSLNKGIMLYGNIGCGKTYTMKSFSVNPKNSYTITAASTISMEYAKDGWDTIMKYGKNRIENCYTFRHKSIGLCIDDMGTEPVNTHYGDRANVLQSIIEARYMQGLFTTTHLTTNLIDEELRLFYGERIFDRLREMFNLITFPEDAPSKRK